jgi:hypothetical protein
MMRRELLAWVGRSISMAIAGPLEARQGVADASPSTWYLAETPRPVKPLAWVRRAGRVARIPWPASSPASPSRAT